MTVSWVLACCVATPSSPPLIHAPTPKVTNNLGNSPNNRQATFGRANLIPVTEPNVCNNIEVTDKIPNSKPERKSQLVLPDNELIYKTKFHTISTAPTLHGEGSSPAPTWPAASSHDQNQPERRTTQEPVFHADQTALDINPGNSPHQQETQNGTVAQRKKRDVVQADEEDSLAGKLPLTIHHNKGDSSLSRARRNASAHDPPNDEVAAMLSDILATHLPGCHKVVLYEAAEPFMSAAGTVAAALEETRMVWGLRAFLASPPPAAPLLTATHPRQHTSSHCVVFVVLATVQAVGDSVAGLQWGHWFQGADRLLLAYTGPAPTLQAMAAHPTLGSGYSTVVAGWAWGRDRHGGGAYRKYPLAAACPYCRDGGPHVAVRDWWQPRRGLVDGAPLYPDIFKNFQGHRFNIVTLQYAPFSCYNKGAGVAVVLGDCVDTRMLHAMARTLNFTYTVREPTDQQWGYRLDNGTYTGVIGAVQKREADFSLNVAFTGDRARVIDYTLGYFNDPLTFCTTRPRPLHQALALVRPFSPLMWAGFAAMLVVVGGVYHVVCVLLGHPDRPPPSLTLSLLNIYGSCLSQQRQWPHKDGPRVVVATWMLFCLVTMTSYVAMLTASFTLPSMSPTLNSLEELVKSDSSWGIQDQGAADFQLLKSSTVPLYQRVFQGLQLCPSLDKCIMRARDTHFAFITWRLYMEDRIAIKFTSATGEPQLHVATNDFFPSEIGWAMSPGCPYRDKFNHQIRRLLEAGLISRWLSQIIHDPQRREAVEPQDLQLPRGHQTLGLGHLQGIFYILIIGCCLSLITFIIEIVHHYMHN